MMVHACMGAGGSCVHDGACMHGGRWVLRGGVSKPKKHQAADAAFDDRIGLYVRVWGWECVGGTHAGTII